MSAAKNWKWYAGNNDEGYEYGPFDTREEALAEGFDHAGEGQGVYVVEAVSGDNLRIADWLAFNSVLETADENFGDHTILADDDDGPWFECSPAQETDLAERLKKAANEWQDHHGLKFSSQTFLDTRNAEFVHPNAETTA